MDYSGTIILVCDDSIVDSVIIPLFLNGEINDKANLIVRYNTLAHFKKEIELPAFEIVG